MVLKRHHWIDLFKWWLNKDYSLNKGKMMGGACACLLCICMFIDCMQCIEMIWVEYFSWLHIIKHVMPFWMCYMFDFSYKSPLNRVIEFSDWFNSNFANSISFIQYTPEHHDQPVTVCVNVCAGTPSRTWISSVLKIVGVATVMRATATARWAVIRPSTGC